MARAADQRPHRAGGIANDWRDESAWWRAEAGWQPGQVLSVGDAVFRMVEVFELATRLATSALGDERMVVNLGIHGIEGRALHLDLPHRAPLFHDYVADVPSFERTTMVVREALAADPIAPALTFAVELFRRFHWDVDVPWVRGIWDQLARGT